MYRSDVRYDYIAKAAAALPCPVLANGNIDSVERAVTVWRETGVRGLMIGRGAIRNPWLFEQIRCLMRGEPMVLPTGRDVLEYIHALYESICDPKVREAAQVQHMKAYLNFIGEGVEPTGRFLHEIRRVTTRADFFRVCADYLEHDRPLRLESSASQRRRDGVVLADAVPTLNVQPLQ
jgi:tRNA-dihydrouridine synthase